jgi:hypothetical protein
MKFESEVYLKNNPYRGDSDVEIKCQTVKIVTARKDHFCAMSRIMNGGTHDVKTGQKAFFEKAIVDGEWRSSYTCIDCMDHFLINHVGLDPNGKH